MSTMSNTSSQRANPITTALMAIALTAATIVAIRLGFVKGPSQVANHWLLGIAGAALVIQMAYCKFTTTNNDNSIYLFFGFIAAIMIAAAASRVAHQFLFFKLTGLQPQTAVWWMVAAIVMLALGLYVQNFVDLDELLEDD